jgi:hypothetical protein
MTVIWIRPGATGVPTFAKWGNATFALVRPMDNGLWRASLFPAGHSEHSKDAFVGSEARARQLIERWAHHHGQTIGQPAARTSMPHEGLPLRKPKGLEDRS